MRVAVTIIGLLAGVMSLIGLRDLFFGHQVDLSQYGCEAIAVAQATTVQLYTFISLVAVVAAVVLLFAADNVAFKGSSGMLLFAGLGSVGVGLFSLLVATAAYLVSCSDLQRTPMTETGSVSGLLETLFYCVICALTLGAVLRSSSPAT
jgi:hypothetical protein